MAPASIPIATIYDTPGSRGGSKTGAPEGAGLDTELSMKAAVINAALDLTASSSDFFVTPSCSTGNCTWPSYQSLAICSTCKDVTNHLTAKPAKFGNTWNLPNGLSLEVDNAQANEGLVSLTFNNSQTTPNLSSIAFPKNTSDLALLDLFVLIGPTNYSISGIQTPAFASECLLNVCLQSYNASSTNSIFHESQKEPPQLLSKPSGDFGPLASGKFSFQYEAAKVLEIYLGDTFSGSVKEANSIAGTVAFPDFIIRSD